MAEPDEHKIARDWFDAAALYAGGYPRGLSSALRLFPPVREEIERIVRALAPRRAIEIGPGDRPVIAWTERPVYLDAAPYFLRDLAGDRVRGDLRRVPFRAGSFDLSVACDVLGHVPPEDRAIAIEELSSLAPRAIVFNPEAPSEDATPSPLSGVWVAMRMREAGFVIDHRLITAETRRGPFSVSLILARRAHLPAMPEARLGLSQS